MTNDTEMTMRNREATSIDITKPLEKVTVPSGGLKISKTNWNPQRGLDEKIKQAEAAAAAYRETIAVDPVQLQIIQLTESIKDLQRSVGELYGKLAEVSRNG